MSTVYGVLGRTLYRMATLKNDKILPIENFKSSVYNRENTSDRHLTTMIKFNTSDFFLQQSNESLYQSIIDYLKSSETKGIDTLYTEFKVGVDYYLADDVGNVISEGVTLVPAMSRDVYINYPLKPNNKLCTKRAKLIEAKVNMERFIPAKYGIMDMNPAHNFVFRVNSVYVLGNLTNRNSDQYIRHLNPSIINTTFPYSSGTYKGLERTHVKVFDSRMACADFNEIPLNYKPTSITVDFQLILDNFCEVYDDTEIWRLIEQNGGIHSSDPYQFEPREDPFRPVIDHDGHCPHNGVSHGDNYGHIPYTDGMIPFGPKPGWDKPPILPPINPPGTDSDGYPVHPHPPKPPCDDPDCCPPPPHHKPPVVPMPNAHPHHGHFHRNEWCKVAEGDHTIPDSAKFLVVADNTPDEEFDAITMVRFSKVRPYVTDIQIGDYVYKQDTLYI